MNHLYVECDCNDVGGECAVCDGTAPKICVRCKLPPSETTSECVGHILNPWLVEQIRAREIDFILGSYVDGQQSTFEFTQEIERKRALNYLYGRLGV